METIEEKNTLAMVLVPLLLLAIGLFCLICAWKDYDWFMEHRKAKALTGLFGRKGARWFYIVLGAVLTLAGLFLGVGSLAMLQA